ncbi:MAG TPA: DUF2158 domain-containing protein [Methylomirabilota bacterium]|nr:DUF2158 domain-containing protein [Methylomirabilota bacterium]
MAQTFKTGDVVQLKSGGPKMTIAEVDHGGQRYFCKWFAGAKIETGAFHVDTLKPASAQKKED